MEFWGFRKSVGVKLCSMKSCETLESRDNIDQATEMTQQPTSIETPITCAQLRCHGNKLSKPKSR